nr:MAG TPA: helix-turn-helix domain protein [Caudoviricetes sp.]
MFDPYAPVDDFEANRNEEMASSPYAMSVGEIRDFVAYRFEKEIKRRGLTQIKAAELCGISQAQVSNIINMSGNVSLEYMIQACEKLGVQFEMKLVSE